MQILLKMEANKLNQKLENEIKKFISDSSCYKCKEKEITQVEQIQIFLGKDYATHMSDYITFEGTARFTFKTGTNNEDSLSPSPLKFSGSADVRDFKVVKVKTPIIIHN